MNSWPLISAALVMGALGSIHCVTMCSALQHTVLRGIPIVTARPDPGGRRSPDWLHFQSGRITGYASLGLAAGLVGERLLAAAALQPVFESVWAALNAALLALGLALLLLGREPGWLLQISRRAPRLGALASRYPFVKGLAWALLPCGLLYGAVGIAILAGSPAGSAAVMLAFGLGTTLGLSVIEAGFRSLLARTGEAAVFRVNGLLLSAAAGTGLVAAVAGYAHPFCG